MQVGKEPVDDAALPQKRKRKTCSVTGCNFYAQARGACYKHGSVRQTRRLCCMPGCKSQAYTKACGMSHQEGVLCARMQHVRSSPRCLLQAQRVACWIMDCTTQPGKMAQRLHPPWRLQIMHRTRLQHSRTQQQRLMQIKLRF